jgi:hypothetical protein
MSDNSYAPDTSWDSIRWAIDAPFQSSLHALHQPGLTDCGHLYDDLFLHEQVPYVLSHVRDESRYSYQPRTIYDPLKIRSGALDLRESEPEITIALRHATDPIKTDGSFPVSPRGFSSQWTWDVKDKLGG